MRQLIVIAHDMRSTHNVGSLLRTAEGLGVHKVYLTGYTPYPEVEHDDRLPHISRKLDQQIDKTALGSAKLIAWQHDPDVYKVISELKDTGYRLVALEQTTKSVRINDYVAPNKVALVLGTEVSGLPEQVLQLMHDVVEIPMLGKKESFNVVQAAAMTLYRLRFH